MRAYPVPVLCAMDPHTRLVYTVPLFEDSLRDDPWAYVTWLADLIRKGYAKHHHEVDLSRVEWHVEERSLV